MKKILIFGAICLSFLTGCKDDEVAVQKIEIDLSKITIEVGQQQTLTATVTPDNAADKTVKWSSQNPEIATVSADGAVSGISVGETLVSAEAGEKRWRSAVVVVPATVYVSGVTLDQTTLLLNPGTDATLKATVTPEDATNKSVLWSSSNTAVATVSSSGKVSGLTVGTSTVTVTTVDGAKTATCAVTVEIAVIPVTGVTVEPTALLLGVGAKSTLTASVIPSSATNKDVTWSSSNQSVATVNSATGEVTGVAAGTATITASTVDGNKTAACTVTVIAFADFTDPYAGAMVAVQGGTMSMPISGGTAVNVTIKSYYIGKYEITQKIWETVVKTVPAYASNPWPNSDFGPNATYGKGDNYPAGFVSWNNIVEIFLPALKALTGKNYRLPTEAEWEFAARGGTKSQGFLMYSGSDNIAEVAWFGTGGGVTGNAEGKSHEVGLLKPNELGLHDMTGNMWEWCSDWYGTTYPTGDNNPVGPDTGTKRVLKGGSWYNNSGTNIRLPYRHSCAPDQYDTMTSGRNGFRLVLDP